MTTTETETPTITLGQIAAATGWSLDTITEIGAALAPGWDADRITTVDGTDLWCHGQDPATITLDHRYASQIVKMLGVRDGHAPKVTR